MLDPLTSLEDQHGQITEWAAQLRALAAFAPGQLGAERIGKLTTFYRASVLPHFRFEEARLFPVLQEVCGVPELGEQLGAIAAEHDELRLRIEILLADLADLAASGPSEVLELETARRARLTIDRLMEHAATEDRLLMPLIDRYRPQVRARLARAPMVIG